VNWAYGEETVVVEKREDEAKARLLIHKHSIDQTYDGRVHYVSGRAHSSD
jgi:ribosome-associated toxin RatA of RatAB toxin-antitoxin module